MYRSCTVVHCNKLKVVVLFLPQVHTEYKAFEQTRRQQHYGYSPYMNGECYIYMYLQYKVVFLYQSINYFIFIPLNSTTCFICHRQHTCILSTLMNTSHCSKPFLLFSHCYYMQLYLGGLRKWKVVQSSPLLILLSNIKLDKLNMCTFKGSGSTYSNLSINFYILPTSCMCLFVCYLK